MGDSTQEFGATVGSTASKAMDVMPFLPEVVPMDIEQPACEMANEFPYIDWVRVINVCTTLTRSSTH